MSWHVTVMRRRRPGGGVIYVMRGQVPEKGVRFDGFHGRVYNKYVISESAWVPGAVTKRGDHWINKRRWHNAGLTLGQRRRRWPNNKTALGQSLVLSGPEHAHVINTHAHWLISRSPDDKSSRVCFLSNLSILHFSKQDTFSQCWVNVGPISQTLRQRKTSIGWVFRFSWADVDSVHAADANWPFPGCCEWPTADREQSGPNARLPIP